MVERGSGVIVNVGSMSAAIVNPAAVAARLQRI